MSIRSYDHDRPRRYAMQCEDCGRSGRVRYVAKEQTFPSGSLRFGAVRHVLCDRCVQNYEQPPAALAAEAEHGIDPTKPGLKAWLQRVFRVPV